MSLIVGILLEVAFLEILIIILLLIISKKPIEEKPLSEFQEIKTKKESKRSFKEPKIIQKESKIKKQKTAEFRRFLFLLIPLAILAYILFSKYTGIHVSILTLILILFGILILSILIFFSLTKMDN